MYALYNSQRGKCIKTKPYVNKKVKRESAASMDKKILCSKLDRESLMTPNLIAIFFHMMSHFVI